MMSKSLMHIDVPVPADSASYDDSGAVLRVGGVPGGPLEFRVDEGLVFARYLSREPRLWTGVSVASVMQFFAHDSPVSTWLRKQGAFPLRQLLVDSRTRSDEDGDRVS
jgi:hypothetical protein